MCKRHVTSTVNIDMPWTWVLVFYKCHTPEIDSKMAFHGCSGLAFASLTSIPALCNVDVITPLPGEVQGYLHYDPETSRLWDSETLTRISYPMKKRAIKQLSSHKIITTLLLRPRKEKYFPLAVMASSFQCCGLPPNRRNHATLSMDE